MKKHLLILSAAFLLLAGNSNAQNIINASADDFEVWAPDPLTPSIKDPNTGFNANGWQCLNVMTYFLLGSSPQSVFKDSTVVHSGTYACQIKSVVLSPSSYGYVKSFLPHDTMGIVFSGVITNTPSIKLGVPFTSRPLSINFYYQYAPANNGKPDTAFCSVVLSHHTVTGRNTIGAGIAQMNAAGTWTLASVPIFYDSTWAHNIDTITVLFSSSSFYKPIPGSILYVDGASVVMGINELHASSTNVNIYPNPATNSVNFNILPASGSVAGYGIEIFDLTGKKVNTYRVNNNLTTINTDAYNSGLYFYQLYDQSGAQVKVGKFSVVK